MIQANQMIMPTIEIDSNDILLSVSSNDCPFNTAVV